VSYLDMYFCRLISIYLTKGLFLRAFELCDRVLWYFPTLRKYSYFQILTLRGKR